MFRPRNSFQQRAMQVMAWFVFGFCTMVIVTGFFVSSATPLSAQESGEGAESVVEVVAQAAAESQPAGVDPVGVDSKPADAPPAADVKADAEASQEEVPAEPMTLRTVKGEGSSPLDKAISFLGIFALIGVAYLLSNNRKRVNWKLVIIGVALQLMLAIFIFFVPGGEALFALATAAIMKLLDFTGVGSTFIFESFVTGSWEPGLINFAFSVLPTIIFFSALMTIMYHLGIMQKLVLFFAWAMQKTMNVSGAESMSMAANIFFGQTEAPLVVKPYVNKMTQSELMVVMTGGFATVAGGVMAIYVAMLQSTFPDIAGHLIAATVMSAPAALVIAKIMYPETEVPETMGKLDMSDEREDINLLGAASRGAAEGLGLALNVGAMLLAFIALIALVNYIIGFPSLAYNKSIVLGGLMDYFEANSLTIPEVCAAVTDETLKSCVTAMQAVDGAPQKWFIPIITLQDIFAVIFWPFAWVMGVPAQDCYIIGRLLGEKMVINELVAYSSLATLLKDPNVVLQDRSVIIATYALCGFANFSSIGIQLGGIGGIAPDRKQDLAKIAMKAMIGGTLAAFMTATIAGILI